MIERRSAESAIAITSPPTQAGTNSSSSCRIARASLRRRHRALSGGIGCQRAPVGRAVSRHARRLRGALRPMTRDARLSALHRGGFWASGPRFRLLRRPPSYNGGQLPSGSVQRAPRSQVVVPAGGVPGLPGPAVTSRLPQDATPRSAFRMSPDDAPQRARMGIL